MVKLLHHSFITIKVLPRLRLTWLNQKWSYDICFLGYR
jgi:hypothetical protein